MNRKTFALVFAVLTLTVGIVFAKLALPRIQHKEPPDRAAGAGEHLQAVRAVHL